MLLQNFVKALLDVSDNLGRASSVVKESFSKIDESKDTAGAVPLLKTLLEGVEITDKQLAEVHLFSQIQSKVYFPVLLLGTVCLLVVDSGFCASRFNRRSP